MRIRIIKPPSGPRVDGFSLEDFKVGLVYSLPAPLATLMVVEGWAAPVIDNIDPVLPPVRFDVIPVRERRRGTYTAAYLKTRLGLAADRRRRR